MMGCTAIASLDDFFERLFERLFSLDCDEEVEEEDEEDEDGEAERFFLPRFEDRFLCAEDELEDDDEDEEEEDDEELVELTEGDRTRSFRLDSLDAFLDLCSSPLPLSSRMSTLSTVFRLDGGDGDRAHTPLGGRIS